jgi:hypothetical protein
MSTIIELLAKPEKETNGKGIIDWYMNTGYLGDFLEAYAAGGFGEMTYNKETRLYEIHFAPSEAWPKTLEGQVDEADIYLGNPDDDGNYPIDGYVVEGEIRSINGVDIRKMLWR